MQFSLATWNINSVRLRLSQVEKFLSQHAPDILCLQEIKCAEEHFPASDIAKFGYPHQAVHGQKGYNGVAILSKIPFTETTRQGFCGKDDARHVAVTLQLAGTAHRNIQIHNFYVPAGGEEPDPEINDKFAHKLSFLDEMASWFSDHRDKPQNRMILVGDLNVAPYENDVWSHKQLLNVVSHTPVEVDRLKQVQDAHGWIDIMREQVPEGEKLYTWWSYRARDWRASNRGRRLDHIWLTPALRDAWEDVAVITDARDWERPSDHAPVIARLSA